MSQFGANPAGREATRPRPAVDMLTVAAGIACRLWSCIALATGATLIALFVINRTWNDGVDQPLLFRLIVLAWSTLRDLEMTRLPSLDLDQRRLFHYTNRDFGDGFLMGSALAGLAAGTVLWMTASGLVRGDRCAWLRFVGLSAAVAAAIAAYGGWYVYQGGAPSGLALISITAVVPASLAFATHRQMGRSNRPQFSGSGPLVRPLLLLLITAHAALLVPALACAWILLGILVRWTWLTIAL
jgi:hypothetical protein